LLPDSSDPRFERVDWETFRCWWEKKERQKEKVGSELCITKNNNKSGMSNLTTGVGIFSCN